MLFHGVPTSSPNISASSHPNQAARAEFESRYGELGVLPSEKDKSKRSKKRCEIESENEIFRATTEMIWQEDPRNPI